MQKPGTTSVGNDGGAAWLAALLFLYIWVSLKPFADLSTVNLPGSGAQSNVLNQLVAIVLFASMMAFGLRKEMRPLLVRPMILITTLFVWVGFVTLLGPGGAPAIRQMVLAAMLVGMASVFLLLPRDERQLAGILALGASVVIGLCYFGVIFLPRLAIHQAGDFMEPQLAGNWRGIFDHKNNAAPSMVLLAFVGMYVARVRSFMLGLAIFVLAAFFVLQSGGKSAAVLLPAALVLCWLLERGNRFWRLPIVLGVIGTYNALAIGATTMPAVEKFLDGLGIDSTFTGRTDIWTVAIEGIRMSPIFGHGYGGFWGTEGVVYGFREVPTWAVIAPSAHNSFIDVLLAGGVFALALVIIWLVLLPLRDLSRAIERNGPTPLIRLFTRIWVFCLVQSGMESIFLATNGTAWFMMLIAVFGLRLEARAYRRAEAPRRTPIHGALPA